MRGDVRAIRGRLPGGIHVYGARTGGGGRHADLQVAVLVLETVDGAKPMAERTLRAVTHAGTWAEQRAAWTALRSQATKAPE